MEMGRIRILDPVTANKIAAGEVVERPAAVVKELIENSLDAEASRIEIYVEKGGMRLIRVVDDGCGMSARDVANALERHATSKIEREEDLYAVRTMGFRGEALPSIAAVSRFSLLSRRASDQFGTKIVVHGGEKISVSEAGSPAGTEVIAADLFYNTPARLKFLKSEAAETARITATVQRLALARPEVSFCLYINGRTKFVTPGSGKLADVAALVLGEQNMHSMLPLSWQGQLLNMSGFVSKPSLNRSNRNLQYIYVNKRPVYSPLLSDSLQTTYHTLLPRNRFPAAIIFVDIAPSEIDVNVHPTKKEVRFSRERDVYREFLKGVRDVLLNNSLIAELQQPGLAGLETAVASSLPDYGIKIKDANPPALYSMPETRPEQSLFENSCKGSGEEKQEDRKEGETGSSLFPGLAPLGQYKSTYILAQSAAGDLYIIDQHAAHERIIYDQLKKDLSAGNLPVQEILPQTFEFDFQTAALLQENLDIFENLGLKFAVLGNNTFILRTVPAFSNHSLRQEDIAELLTSENNASSDSRLFEKTLQMIACKAAIKANHRLDEQEMTALLRNLAATSQPFTCPHGRPAIMVLTEQAIARNFRRT